MERASETRAGARRARETAVTLPGRHGGRAPLKKQNPEPLAAAGRCSPGHAARLLTARRGQPRGHAAAAPRSSLLHSPCCISCQFLGQCSCCRRRTSQSIALLVHPVTFFFPIFTLPFPFSFPLPRLFAFISPIL